MSAVYVVMLAVYDTLIHRYDQCGPLFVVFIFHQPMVFALDPKDAKVLLLAWLQITDTYCALLGLCSLCIISLHQP